MEDVKDRCAFAMTWLVTLLIAIIIGITTWVWFVPETAFEYLSFMIGWALLGISGHYIAKLIVSLISRIT